MVLLERCHRSCHVLACWCDSAAQLNDAWCCSVKTCEAQSDMRNPKSRVQAMELVMELVTKFSAAHAAHLKRGTTRASQHMH